MVHPFIGYNKVCDLLFYVSFAVLCSLGLFLTSVQGFFFTPKYLLIAYVCFQKYLNFSKKNKFQPYEVTGQGHRATKSVQITCIKFE